MSDEKYNKMEANKEKESSFEDCSDIVQKIENMAQIVQMYGLKNLNWKDSEFELCLSSDFIEISSKENIQSFAMSKSYGTEDDILNVQSSESDTQDQFFKVKSPITGTMYVSSSPKASPFVCEGDRVVRGTVLCIVEAMKMMNEIHSEIEGVIMKILKKNEELVSEGDVLFLIKTSP